MKKETTISLHPSSIWKAFSCILMFVLTLPQIKAQNEGTPATLLPRDSLKPYEIPFLVGEAQERTLRYINDLNGLKGNVSEGVKAQILNYIYEAFEDGDQASVQSDLKFTLSPPALRSRAPITIGKYTSDFETEFDIKSIIANPASFRFSFPENPGPFTYELYGSFEQIFLGENGDTLTPVPQEKLVKYIAQRDANSRNLSVRILSIAILDPDKLPDFMEDEELEILSQQYLKWRNDGSPMDNLALMSNEAIRETYDIARKKRADKEVAFNSAVQNYLNAIHRKDIKTAAEAFLKAEKMQRSHPLILNEKDNIRTVLTNEIEHLYKRTTDAMTVWNYDEAARLISINKELLELWKGLSNRNYDDYKKILSTEITLEPLKAQWDDYEEKILNESSRSQLRGSLSNGGAMKGCKGEERSDEIATSLVLLGLIEMESNSGKSKARTFFEKAVQCKPEFALPKLKLVDLADAYSGESFAYLDDLIYFEQQNPMYYAMRADRFKKKGETDRALADFLRTIDYNPNDSQAMLEVAKIKIERKEYDSAIEKLEVVKSITDDPQADIFTVYALLEKEGSESEKARNFARKYTHIHLDGKSRNVLDSLANLYRSRANYHMKTTLQNIEALVHFEKLYVLAGHLPEYAGDWAEAAQCYYELGNNRNNFERALVLADHSIEQSGGLSAHAYLMKGFVFRDLKDYETSRENLYKLLEIQDSYESNYQLAETYFLEGKEYVVARVYYDKALEKLTRTDPADMPFKIHLRMAQCFRLEGKMDEALESCKQANRSQPLRGDGYYEMGLTYLLSEKKGDLKKSLKAFDTAIRKGYSEYPVRVGSANAYIALDNLKKAKSEFDQIKMRKPQEMSPEVWGRSALVNVHLNDFDGASSDLQSAVSKDNQFLESATYNNLQGVIALKKSLIKKSEETQRKARREEAKNHFTKSINHQIAQPVAYLGLSMCHFYDGNLSEAQKQLSRAREFNLDTSLFENDKAFKHYFKSNEIRRILR